MDIRTAALVANGNSSSSGRTTTGSGSNSSSSSSLSISIPRKGLKNNASSPFVMCEPSALLSPFHAAAAAAAANGQNPLLAFMTPLLTPATSPSFEFGGHLSSMPTKFPSPLSPYPSASASTNSNISSISEEQMYMGDLMPSFVHSSSQWDELNLDPSPQKFFSPTAAGTVQLHQTGPWLPTPPVLAGGFDEMLAGGNRQLDQQQQQLQQQQQEQQQQYPELVFDALATMELASCGAVEEFAPTAATPWTDLASFMTFDTTTAAALGLDVFSTDLFAAAAAGGTASLASAQVVGGGVGSSQEGAAAVMGSATAPGFYGSTAVAAFTPIVLSSPAMAATSAQSSRACRLARGGKKSGSSSRGRFIAASSDEDDDADADIDLASASAKTGHSYKNNKRFRLPKSDMILLKQLFEEKPLPTSAETEAIAQRLGVDDEIWFISLM
ncbi:hypothetical protein HDU83_008517 [Entophlyctis luteolus]|nr:hypothetical protein HDU83_008517 [Entophlyctis luteolus]